MDTIGERIKWVREKRKLGRKAVAAASKIPYPTLAGIENGDQESSTKLNAIAKALRARVEFLETGKGEWDVDVATGERSDTAPGSAQIEELRLAVSLMAQALAESIPPAGKELRNALNDLPGDLPNRDFLAGLIDTLQSQLSRQAALFAPIRPKQGSGGPKRL